MGGLMYINRSATALCYGSVRNKYYLEHTFEFDMDSIDSERQGSYQWQSAGQNSFEALGMIDLQQLRSS